MLKPSDFNFLEKTYFFDALSVEERMTIGKMALYRKYEAGELVFSQGDPAEAFFLVVSGQVQAYKIGPDGKEMILHLVGPGEVFAEYPVFGGISKYPAYALCLEETELLAIPAEAFRTLVAGKPEILMKMLARFSQRIQEFNALIEDLSLRSVDARLAKYLLSLNQNNPSLTTLDVQRKTLAAILGTIPETLSRAFKRMKDQGVIRLEGSQLEILDRGALALMADVEGG